MAGEHFTINEAESDLFEALQPNYANEKEVELCNVVECDAFYN